MTNLSVKYEGSFSGENQLTGDFFQNTAKLPLILTKELVPEVVKPKPQEPQEPFPYKVEEVVFSNPEAGITLAGTLTLPEGKGPYPVVVLISGSGPQNRDEALFGHKPFLVIADHLTKEGIAVLRYDDRGTAASTGDFSKAISTDLAGDVSAAVTFLKTRNDIDKKHIGLAGHSEGGIIAPMVASSRKDIDFIVLLAGPGIPGHELLLIQQQLIGKAMDMTEEQTEKTWTNNRKIFDVVIAETDDETMKANLKDVMMEIMANTSASEKPAGKPDEEIAFEVIKAYGTPWMRFFLKYDPAPTLQKVRCPVLAINGSKDLQVSAFENLSAIKMALEKGRNKKVTIREYPELNHLFQECKIGVPMEYASSEQTISPQVLNDVSDWILRTIQ